MDVVSLTLKLCQIESTSGNERALVDFLETFLNTEGFFTKRIETDENKCPNLYAYTNEKPEILLSTHLDTVPPFIAPKEEGEYLVGRGVCDAKGIMAAMIMAALELKQEGVQNIGLLLVTEEETTSLGAKSCVLPKIPKVKYVIHGEPTDLKMVSAMKGALVLELKAHGKTGHSAYPTTGHSALHQLIEDCHAFMNHAWPVDSLLGPTTVNIGILEGGVAGNVIAPFARALAVFRITKPVDDILSSIKKLIHKETEYQIKSKSEPQALLTLEGWPTCTVAFGSDVPHLSHLGTPILFGPGSILDAHTAQEKVLKKDLIEAKEQYKKIVKHLFL